MHLPLFDAIQFASMVILNITAVTLCVSCIRKRSISLHALGPTLWVIHGSVYYTLLFLDRTVAPGIGAAVSRVLQCDHGFHCWSSVLRLHGTIVLLTAAVLGVKMRSARFAIHG